MNAKELMDYKSNTCTVYDEHSYFAENRAERRKNGERGRSKLKTKLTNKGWKCIYDKPTNRKQF